MHIFFRGLGFTSCLVSLSISEWSYIRLYVCQNLEVLILPFSAFLVRFCLCFYIGLGQIWNCSHSVYFLGQIQNCSHCGIFWVRFRTVHTVWYFLGQIQNCSQCGIFWVRFRTVHTMWYFGGQIQNCSHTVVFFVFHFI